MSGDILPAGTTWQGWPAQLVQPNIASLIVGLTSMRSGALPSLSGPLPSLSGPLPSSPFAHAPPRTSDAASLAYQHLGPQGGPATALSRQLSTKAYDLAHTFSGAFSGLPASTASGAIGGGRAQP